MVAEPGRERYPNVFSPLRIGPVEVWNRVFVPPHGISLQAPAPGHEAYSVPSADFAYYYAERAAGGASLLLHSMHVSPASRQVGLSLTPWFEESIPAFARMAEMVHQHGAKIMAEAWYACHHAKHWERLGPDAPVLGASQGQLFGQPIVRMEMAKAEIGRFVDDYARTAKNLRRAGYDGIEVHACHSAIIEHFLSPYFNRRSDEYGGTVENRCRFLVEVLQAVRSEAGPEMAVGLRINADELVPRGVDAAGTREIIAYLKPLGLLDFVDLDVSIEPEQQHLMTTSFFEPKLHNMKNVSAVSPAARPELVVLAAPGRVTHIAEAESLLVAGDIDMVGINRGQIAEPWLVRNALEGHESRSKICVAANHCIAAGRTATFGCAINPAAAKEERFGHAKFTVAPEQMRVVVAGGGPAGIEASLVAARRGHHVTLFECRSWIGGGLELWSRLPGRQHLGTYASWAERQLADLGVEVRLDTEARPELVVEARPDVVIIATGSRYSPGGESGFHQTPLEGSHQEFVVTPDVVLENRLTLSGNVLVLDEEGMHAAVGVAEMAARQGANVEYVIRQMIPAPELAWNAQLGYAVNRMLQTGVTINTSTFPRRIGEGTVTLYDIWTGAERSVNVDTVVLATMRSSVDELSSALDGSARWVYTIGDALAPRSLREATYEGHRFARAIGDPDMPASVTEALFEPMEAARSAALA